MLTRFSLANFRCFAAVDVPLRPLTVLVGPNDSGKSVFLQALWSLLAGLNPADKRAVAEGEFWVKALRDGAEEIRPANPPRLRLALFTLPSSRVNTTSQASVDQGGPPALAADGSNLATLLDYLLRKDRSRFFKVVNALKESVAGLRDVEIAAPDSNLRRLDFSFDNGLTLPGHSVSAGVTLLTFFLCLAHHPDPPDLVLIEEPENGVHPKRLAQVAGLLRSLTKGEHSGHQAQVIVSTHSPYLLDHVHLPEDEVLVFRRAADGSRTVEPADAAGLKAFLGEFMMGEIWFNRGEDGLVKAPAA